MGPSIYITGSSNIPPAFSNIPCARRLRQHTWQHTPREGLVLGPIWKLQTLQHIRARWGQTHLYCLQFRTAAETRIARPTAFQGPLGSNTLYCLQFQTATETRIESPTAFQGPLGSKTLYCLQFRTATETRIANPTVFQGPTAFQELTLRTKTRKQHTEHFQTHALGRVS